MAEIEKQPLNDSAEFKESFVGKSSWSVIKEIARLNPNIKSFYFAAINPIFYINPPEDLLFHNETPFEEIKINCSSEKLAQTAIGRRILSETITEQGIFSSTRDKFSVVEEKKEIGREDFILGITSLVKLKNGSIKQIPMIDFSSNGIGQDVEKAKNALSHPNLKQRKGFILGSGRGIHYYGTELLTEQEWRDFVYHAGLLNRIENRIVDTEYLFHRLIDGHCCLRISSHPLKPSAPKVLAVFENKSPTNS